MDIKKYLSAEHERVGQLAKDLDLPRAYIYQWMKGIRPVSVIHCAAIEQVTNGAVTRKDLRPDDWHLIWPELKEASHA